MENGMLNEEKVKNMTKAAAYESGAEKKNIEIGNYYRTDYLGLQMLKSGIAYTLAFAILFGLWAMGRMSEVMLLFGRAESVKGMIKVLIILFISGLVFYECVVYAYYSIRYDRARKSLKKYHTYLKQIHKFYEVQESEGDSLEMVSLEDEEKTL